MMSLAFGLFTQVSGSGPLGPLVLFIGQNTISIWSQQGSHLTPDQQSQTPIFGLGLQLFRKI